MKYPVVIVADTKIGGKNGERAFSAANNRFPSLDSLRFSRLIDNLGYIVDDFSFKYLEDQGVYMLSVSGKTKEEIKNILKEVSDKNTLFVVFDLPALNSLFYGFEKIDVIDFQTVGFNLVKQDSGDYQQVPKLSNPLSEINFSLSQKKLKPIVWGKKKNNIMDLLTKQDNTYFVIKDVPYDNQF